MSASSDPTHTKPRGRFRADTLASSVIILLGVTVIQRSIGFARGVLFCRWLDPQQLGLWEMALSFILLASPLAVLGIPGSFGRYLEYYRQRGQLRSFLRRTTIGTSVLCGLALTILLVAAPRFSWLIFGEPDREGLVLLVAISLAMVVLHHFLECVFTGLRMFRIVSTMHFCQSVGFALSSLVLLLSWRMTAASVVIAYGGACAASSAGALLWLRFAFAEVPADGEPPVLGTFWSKLARFAFWVWAVNIFNSLFMVVDRYMIVHFSGMDPDQAMVEIGHYHSSRIVPVLLVSVADLLGGVLLPYLSHDWERGDRKAVSELLNFALKLTAIGMTIVATCVLLASGLLFDVALAGKYDGGRAIMPMTLAYCTFNGLFVIAQMYLWCAEKTRWTCIPLMIALAANVGLNALLMPHYGLAGAILATTVANAAALAITFRVGGRVGMQVEPGTWILCFVPACLCGGLPTALAGLAVILVALLARDALLSPQERGRLATIVTDRLKPLARFLRPSTPSPAGPTP